VGVLGGGVDVVYPAKNRTLYRRAEENGCLISEYPPGHRPYPWNFLHRNRIISGISDGVLVVEAPEKSGALNTARHAVSQGRDLFVVPGNLGVDTCAGSNLLLQEGAYAALSGWDVVKHYAPLYPGAVENRPVTLQKNLSKVAQRQVMPEKGEKKKADTSQNVIDNLDKSTYSVINKRPSNLSDQENGVFALLSETPQLIDSILDASDLPSGTVQSILTRLAIKGLVTQYPDGRICKK
jgi:DNA processing protein